MPRLDSSTFRLTVGEPTYRAYRLTPSGKIAGVENIVAQDDEDARRQAAELVNGHGIDLWERARFLGNFPPLGASVQSVKV